MPTLAVDGRTVLERNIFELAQVTANEVELLANGRFIDISDMRGDLPG